MAHAVTSPATFELDNRSYCQELVGKIKKLYNYAILMTGIYVAILIRKEFKTTRDLVATEFKQNKNRLMVFDFIWIHLGATVDARILVRKPDSFKRANKISFDFRL